MKLGYLGDASDHWKGSLHEHLRRDGLLRDLHAIGMFADGPWAPMAVEAYARLLRLAGAGSVVDAHTAVPSGKLRHGYFTTLGAAVPADADLFIDPDTGIREPWTTSKAHVSVSELGAVLVGDRILMVFDEGHDRRIEKSQHVCTLAGALVGLRAHAVAYESGRGVTMFFVSRSAPRMEALLGSLTALLGPAASRRVTAYP